MVALGDDLTGEIKVFQGGLCLTGNRFESVRPREALSWRAPGAPGAPSETETTSMIAPACLRRKDQPGTGSVFSAATR